MKLPESHITRQRTLKNPISYIGTGLHTGEKISMVIHPTNNTNGIHFIRKDISADKNTIAARWYNVVSTNMSTTISNLHGTSVKTIEHLMAAFAGCGIDNAIVEIDGTEVPIMDGSSMQFVSMIKQAGIVETDTRRNIICIQKPIEVRYGDKLAILLPSNTPRITVEIDFPDSAIGFQTLSVELLDDVFTDHIANARTFGFISDIEYLKNNNLGKGGTLKNAVLVDGHQIVNPEGLRYDDEFVRHKILDCFGDLALAGSPIMGHLYTHKPGHQLNNLLLRELYRQRESWIYISADEFNSMTGAQQLNTTILAEEELEPEVNRNTNKLTHGGLQK